MIGLGAADFLNLVFNRDDNRNPWAEALALTYRNHVIVFGAGHVGQRVIRDLVAMDLDVVAIDNSPSATAKKRLGEMGCPDHPWRWKASRNAGESAPEPCDGLCRLVREKTRRIWRPS